MVKTYHIVRKIEPARESI